MAERSVMAQIFVFGRVMNDLVPKESQSKQSYVCFDLIELRPVLSGMGLGCRCHPAHAIQGQKRQYDLACRLTAAGRCSHEGR